MELQPAVPYGAVTSGRVTPSSCPGKSQGKNWMLSMASSKPTLLPIAFARWRHPSGVACNAVPEQSWLVKLRRTRAIINYTNKEY